MKPPFLKTLSIFTAALLIFSFLFAPDSFAKSKAKPKSLKVAPKQMVVSVDQIPENTVSLVVPLTFDSNIVNILSVSSSSDGALVVFNQNGVGLIQTSGNLPSMFNLIVNFKGVKRGKTNISTGEVVDKLGGTPIEGAIATTKTKKIKAK